MLERKFHVLQGYNSALKWAARVYHASLKATQSCPLTGEEAARAMEAARYGA